MTKLWKDMSRAEKGEILLAHYEGKTIQCNLFGGNAWSTFHDITFSDQHAYRVKPEPMVREVELYFGKLVEGALVRKHWSDTHKLKMKLIDGIPPEGYFVNENGDLIVVESIGAPF